MAAPAGVDPELADRSWTVAIVQSSYIPWKGYFDLMASADEFILLDDVQYTRRDWRSRNVIRSGDRLQWLSVPVQKKGRYTQMIKEARIADPAWARRHWSTILHAYRRAAHFDAYRKPFEDAYRKCESLTHLSEVNHALLSAINQVLGIRTRITWSMDYGVAEPDKTRRLVSLCNRAGATRYLSGPSARDYLREDDFEREGVALSFMEYDGYPEYRQSGSPFEHQVSVLDLIFNEGPAAREFMKSRIR